MMSMRQEVLNCFRKLHKTRKYIFDGDNRALVYLRDKINSEFKNNKDVQEESKIKELINFASAVDHEVRTTIVQAKEVRPNVYEARIKPETVKTDNVMFNEELVALHSVDPRNMKKCCQEKEKK